MVVRTVPKSSLFREVKAKFLFDYQVAGDYAGQYVCTDNVQNLLDMVENSTYLIDNISISTSIPENILVESLQEAAFISLRFRRYRRNEIMSAEPIVISQFYREKTISRHVICNNKNDGLKLEMLGHLDQVAETVGIDTIAVSVSIGTYQIDTDYYNKYSRDID